MQYGNEDEKRCFYKGISLRFNVDPKGYVSCSSCNGYDRTCGSFVSNVVDEESMSLHLVSVGRAPLPRGRNREVVPIGDELLDLDKLFV